MIYNANRDAPYSVLHLPRKGEPFVVQTHPQPSNDPKTPKSNNNIVNSRPSLKLSFVSTAQNTNTSNKTLQSIRNSCFVGNIVPQRDQQNKPFANINNSFRFSEYISSSPHEDARRKSESNYMKNLGNTVKGIKQVQITHNTEGVLNLIEDLQKRVLKNTQQICKLQQRSDKDKKLFTLQTEVVELKSKMLQFGKINNKTNNQYDCKLLEYSLKLNEVKQRIANFNPSQHMKKYGILQAKLNQLYEGFKIRQEYNERELVNSINNLDLKAKEYVNIQTFKINQSLKEVQEDCVKFQAKISKLEEEMISKMKNLTFSSIKSDKKSDIAIILQKKQSITIKENRINPIQQTSKQKNANNPSQQTTSQPIKTFLVSETKYCIDSEGYLLDQDCFYLLNSKNQQILLSPQLIQCLRKNGIIDDPSCIIAKP